MSYNTLMYEESEGIGLITINRPKSLNALNAEVLHELVPLLESICRNDDLDVLIFTGAGEKAFVAGADISELAEFTPLEAKDFAEKGHRVMSMIQELPIPVIAAVNGFALGGGLELALSCDFIYASQNAKFGQPEINLGIIPGFGGTQRLARIVGKNIAKEMIFTGKTISAEEGRSLGFVNRVLSPEALLDEVKDTAKLLSSKGKVALNAAKQAINRGMDVDLATGCSIEIDAFALCLASADAKEGTSAFLEKRKPNFTGSLKG
jgi:enoyl-CoA hydratase